MVALYLVLSAIFVLSVAVLLEDNASYLATFLAILSMLLSGGVLAIEFINWWIL